MLATPALPANAARILPLAGGIAVLDLAVKFLMQAWLGTGGTWWLIDDNVGFELVHNRRLAFNLGPDTGATIIVTFIAIGILLALLVGTQIGTDTLPLIGASMILGGAIGNLIDRLIHGYVIDFVAVFSFPRFNVADASLTLGIATIALSELIKSRNQSSQNR
jgi:signal peptidase II